MHHYIRYINYLKHKNDEAIFDINMNTNGITNRFSQDILGTWAGNVRLR